MMRSVQLLKRFVVAGWITALVAVPTLAPAEAARFGFELVIPAKQPYVMASATPASTAKTQNQTLERANAQARQILQRLRTANEIPASLAPSIRVVRSNALNAYTNGQNIIITDTMWNTLRTTDQRAFVVSHELAHIVASHVQKTQLRRVGLAILDRYLLDQYITTGGGWWDTAGNVGLSLLDRYYARNMEYHADELGLDLMYRAGYNPHAAIQVLNILQQNQQGYLPAFLMDHPLESSRIERLVERYDIQQRR